MINTKRLKLRNVLKSDFDDIYEMYSDAQTCKYLLHEPWDENTKDSLFIDLFEKDNFDSESGLNLAVVLDDKVIGIISTWQTEMKETAEIGFTFNKNFSGQGYASEAALGLLDFLFVQKNMHRVIANCDARNTASAKLCKRIGMRKEAHFIKDYWNKGEWTDSFIFAVLQEELD